tara:strand:+ start:236466 stop:236969 length:504 start_codon:yes stop_codon:yes gene_type:complete
MEIKSDVILDHTQIQHIIRRIAYQIYEANADESEVLLAGIYENGYVFAQKIKKVLEKISPLQVNLCKVNLDKKQPINSVTSELDPVDFENKSIVVIDDVLHSGSTLIYGVNYFLQVPLKKIKTGVLIDRSHKQFPIKADFKGISLSTSLNENVRVIFEKNNDRAALE